MLPATDTPVGETLLIREYLLDEVNSSTQLLSSITHPTGNDLLTSTPQQKSSECNTHQPLQPVADIPLQSLPYSRPVTPQTFNRPHTASKALLQHCKWHTREVCYCSAVFSQSGRMWYGRRFYQILDAPPTPSQQACQLVDFPQKMVWLYYPWCSKWKYKKHLVCNFLGNLLLWPNSLVYWKHC